MTTCRRAGCDERHYARGLCTRHYDQARAYFGRPDDLERELQYEVFIAKLADWCVRRVERAAQGFDW